MSQVSTILALRSLGEIIMVMVEEEVMAEVDPVQVAEVETVQVAEVDKVQVAEVDPQTKVNRVTEVVVNPSSNKVMTGVKKVVKYHLKVYILEVQEVLNFKKCQLLLEMKVLNMKTMNLVLHLKSLQI